jgi:hypothetical protein
MRTRVLLTAVALVCLANVGSAAPGGFRTDVMAVLSKAGCNQGACHGNQNGKGGLKLSLRGEDPDADLATLTRDLLGRRVNRQRPDDSLLLLKPLGAVSHEGGQRFRAGSPEHAILRDWIAAGLPADSNAPTLRSLTVTPVNQVLVEPADRVTLQVRATFSDGGVRDVTRLAVYETSNLGVSVGADGVVVREKFGEATVLVRYLDRQTAVQLAFVPARSGYVWNDTPENNYVDRYVFAKLRSLRVLPSELSTDAVFLRRAYLDAIGLTPTADEARRFLDDPRPDKRARLIDSLVDRPEFADFWALKWSDLLKNEEKALDPKGVRAFHAWIRQSFIDRRPLNEFARDLVSARGSTYSEPAANFYRSLRDPHARAEAVAQVFLGVRMQCAKCHNHPFDRWTQHDYHSLAAFFARIDYRIVENNRRDKFDKHEFDGDQIVYLMREGEVKHPRSGEQLRPRFLGGPTPDLGPTADRLQSLADWIASPDNVLFARAQANRVWYHLLGRGLVEPNDDFRASNPPSNAPLLDALARDLAEHRFDLRYLVGVVMKSRTYQLSAVPNETNRDDENFSLAAVRPLQAEQLLDALARATDTTPSFTGQPRGVRAGQLPGVKPNQQRGSRPTEGERFLTAFGKPDRLLTCECERSDDTTLGQAFQMLTGEMLQTMLSEEDNRIGRALGRSDADVIEEFYLAALARRPSATERDGALAFLKRAKQRRPALEDLLWGLVNSKEFLLRW